MGIGGKLSLTLLAAGWLATALATKNGDIERGNAAYEAGALVRVSGANMIMSPPLVLERKDSQTIVDAVTHALQSVRLDPAQ